MNARIRDKQAAYLAAMGREPAEDPRGPNVVELRPPGSTDADEVTVTFDNPRRTRWIRGKVTRQIIAEICRELGRTPAQVVATPTKQSTDADSAWIKANDGPDATIEGGQRLAFVTGLTPTVINIVLGHPIERIEQVKGRFYPLGSSQAKAAHAAVRAAAGGAPAAEPTPDETDDQVDDLALPEPDLSGDDE